MNIYITPENEQKIRNLDPNRWSGSMSGLINTLLEDFFRPRAEVRLEVSQAISEQEWVGPDSITTKSDLDVGAPTVEYDKPSKNRYGKPQAMVGQIRKPIPKGKK